MSMLAEPRRKNKWSFNPRGLKNGGENEKFGNKHEYIQVTSNISCPVG